MNKHKSIKSYLEIKKRSEMQNKVRADYGDDVHLCIAIEIAWMLLARDNKRVFTKADNDPEMTCLWQKSINGHQVMLLPEERHITDLLDEEAYAFKPSQEMLDEVLKKYNMKDSELHYDLQFNLAISYTRLRSKLLDVFIYA